MTRMARIFFFPSALSALSAVKSFLVKGWTADFADDADEGKEMVSFISYPCCPRYLRSKVFWSRGGPRISRMTRMREKRWCRSFLIRAIRVIRGQKFHAASTSLSRRWQTPCAGSSRGCSRWSIWSLSRYSPTISGRTRFIAFTVCSSRMRVVTFSALFRQR